MRIRYTAGARLDLVHLRRHVIDRFDDETWSRTLAELRDRVALLLDQPLLGSVPPELEVLGIVRYLELTVGRNRVIYELRSDAVFVLMVVDHRRDFRAVLSRRLIEPPADSTGAEAE